MGFKIIRIDYPNDTEAEIETHILNTFKYIIIIYEWLSKGLVDLSILQKEAHGNFAVCFNKSEYLYHNI